MRRKKEKKVRDPRGFYLVQRMKRSFQADREPKETDGPLQKLRNPFGYGHMGDYDLDYMGAAEFEWGAIPEAAERLNEASKKGDITLGEMEYNGYVFDVLYITSEGDPTEDFARWAKGGWWYDEFGKGDWVETDRVPPFDGKEPPFELKDRLEGKPPIRDDWRTHIWWALGANVVFAFKEDGHLHLWLESIGSKDAR